MVEFTYSGVDKAGKKVNGKVEAPTEGELRMLLRGKGVRPTRIIRFDLAAAGRSLFKTNINKVRIPLDVMLIFTRQLYVLTSSGIPLIQAIETLADQTNHAQMKILLTNVKNRVAEGSYLWEALAQYPNTFSNLFISLIRAGESSGAMDEMLKRLTSYMEDSDRLKKLLKSAMIYPALVILVSFVVIGIMMVFVIPKFEQMLKEGGQELPEFTQVVLEISHFFVNNALLIILGGGSTIGLTMRFFRTPEGRNIRDRALFKAPLFGMIMQKGGVARFARTLNTLLAAGVSLLDAIDICKATVDNAVIEESVAKIRLEVEQGNRLGTVMSKMPVFPKMMVQMVQVGESSGSLDQMLEKVADFYEAEVETLVGGISKLIEPLIIVFLGGTVGALLVAMYLPIFKLAGGVSE